MTTKETQTELPWIAKMEYEALRKKLDAYKEDLDSLSNQLIETLSIESLKNSIANLNQAKNAIKSLIELSSTCNGIGIITLKRSKVKDKEIITVKYKSTLKEYDPENSLLKKNTYEKIVSTNNFKEINWDEYETPIKLEEEQHNEPEKQEPEKQEPERDIVKEKLEKANHPYFKESFSK